jgi:DNA polymerase-2
VKEKYSRISFFEIQFEKLFKIFLMPKIRGSVKEDEGGEVGAKKRYAGLLIKDGKEEMSFTGMEFVRGDWTDLAKKFQLKLFEMIFNKKEVDKYIREFVSDLKEGKYDDLLVYKKNIKKPLSEYTKTTPPHVKAARMLKRLTSNQIQYVMTTHGPEPIELLKHKPDYEHYVDKQIKPIADTILSVYGKSFDDILKSSTQSKLFGY